VVASQKVVLMADDIDQKIAAKAVIVHDGKILVLREADTNPDGTNSGRYDVPGGRLEPGEPFYEALRREVEEETGIKDLNIKEPLYVDEWSPIIRGVKTQIVALFITCETKDSEITLSEEHDSYKWISQTELDGLDLIQETAAAARKYFESHD